MNLFSSFSQNIAYLLNVLNEFENPKIIPKIILGLSGGLDSVVLLDLLYKYILDNSDNPDKKINLTAVYINHQLQSASDDWEEFNRAICQRYNNILNHILIDFKTYKVNINKNSELGLEGEARLQRYNIFKNIISDSQNITQNILVTAHHLNDQAETVLLQLMRAAGPKGLSAMPAIKKLGTGWHIRPLLNFSRSELLDYAELNNLRWIEDLSNNDNNFDRNYLRNIVIPQLQSRWPKAVNLLAISAQHCASQQKLLDDYIKKDYEKCLAKNNCINLDEFKLFNNLTQHAILRYWFSQNSLKSPGQKKINEIIKSVVNARIDAKPKYIIENKIITRYKKHLYLLDSLEVGELL